MHADLREYFLREVDRIFAFLVETYGFSGPEVIVDQEIHFIFVVYQARNLAIELILDEREEHVDCKVARVTDGRKTVHYERDDSGQLVRDSLSNVLRTRGHREPLFRRVGHLGFVDQIPSLLADFAAMLRTHGEDILRDSPTVFRASG